MKEKDIMLNIDYHDRYKWRVEIESQVMAGELLLALLKYFHIEDKEQYAFSYKESDKQLDDQQSLAAQGIAQETNLRIVVRKVNVIVEDITSGKETVLKNVPVTSTTEAILEAALKSPALGLKQKKSDYILKEEVKEGNNRQTIIRDNMRFKLIPNTRIKVRIQQKPSRDFEKEAQEILDSRKKAAKHGFSTCDDCGYKWVVEKCYSCGKDHTPWLEAEEDFEKRKAEALRSLKFQQTSYPIRFVDAQLPLSYRCHDVMRVYLNDHARSSSAENETDEGTPYLFDMVCLENQRSLTEDIDLYDAGVKEGSTISLDYRVSHSFLSPFSGTRRIIGDPPVANDYRSKASFIQFIEWFKGSYPDLSLLVSMPEERLRQLEWDYMKRCFSEGDRYHTMLNWFGSSMRGRSPWGILINSLKELNERVDSDGKVTQYDPDRELEYLLSDYKQYASFRYSALFLSLSVQKKAFAFKDMYWRKVAALTKDKIDIHYSPKDATSKLGDGLEPELQHLFRHGVSLPGLLVWEKEKGLESCIIVPMAGITEQQLYTSFKLVVQATRQNLACKELASYLREETKRILGLEIPVVVYAM